MGVVEADRIGGGVAANCDACHRLCLVSRARDGTVGSMSKASDGEGFKPGFGVWFVAVDTGVLVFARVLKVRD